MKLYNIKKLKIIVSVCFSLLILVAKATKEVQLVNHEAIGSECVLVDSSWVLAPNQLALRHFLDGVKFGEKVYDIHKLIPLYTNNALALLYLREPITDIKPVSRLRQKKGFQFPAHTKLMVISSEETTTSLSFSPLNSPARIVIESGPLQEKDNDINIDNKFLFIDHWTMVEGELPVFDRTKRLAGTLNIFNSEYKLARVVYQAQKDQFQLGILLDKGIVKVEPFSPKENTEIDNIIIQHAIQPSEVAHLFTRQEKVDLTSKKGIGYQAVLIDSSWIFVGPNLEIGENLVIGSKTYNVEHDKRVCLFKSNLSAVYPLKEPVLDVRPVQRARLNLEQPFSKGTRFMAVVMGPQKRKTIEPDLSNRLQSAYQFQAISDVTHQELYQMAKEMLPAVHGSTGSGAIYLINQERQPELIGFVGFDNIALPRIINAEIDNAIIKRALAQ